MLCDLVLSGAGVRGISELGSLKMLEKNGYQFKNICGTSAGSLIASLLFVGYSVDELYDIMFDLDYKNMMDNKSKFPFKKYIDLFTKKGLYDGDWIEDWLFDLLKKKGKTKFKDILDEKGNCNLKIIASDITRRKVLVLPDDLKEYNIDWKEFSIAKAVRMSISIPMFFKPVIIDYVDDYGIQKKSYIVDGGLLQNYCSSIVSIFDVDEKPKYPTFGISLASKRDNYIDRKTSIIKYAQYILDTMIDSNDNSRFMKKEDKDSVRTIIIETHGISSTNFNLSKRDCLYLYESGIDEAKLFLDSWDFQEYIKKYRS